ncbi:MAG: hypothetical protein NTW08_02290 [Gammaproteobacteria bacterium]|nr:hypothetical protein [Gammaproteobacteria bacterium]
MLASTDETQPTPPEDKAVQINIEPLEDVIPQPTCPTLYQACRFFASKVQEAVEPVSRWLISPSGPGRHSHTD